MLIKRSIFVLIILLIVLFNFKYVYAKNEIKEEQKSEGQQTIDDIYSDWKEYSE